MDQDVVVLMARIRGHSRGIKLVIDELTKIYNEQLHTKGEVLHGTSLEKVFDVLHQYKCLHAELEGAEEDLGIAIEKERK